MPDHKLKIGGILVSRSLGMISVLGTPRGPGMAGVAMETLGNAGINVEFISCCPDSGGGDNIVVCVEQSRLQEALTALDRVRERIRPVGMTTSKDLVALSVFGPHFREIPAVAGRVFRALADAGVTILAISTSISSVTSVFDQTMLDPALSSLRRRFDVE